MKKNFSMSVLMMGRGSLLRIFIAALVAAIFVCSAALDVEAGAKNKSNAKNQPKSKSATEMATQSAKDTMRNESIKKAIADLDLMGRLSNPKLAAKARQQLLQAAENLPDTVFKELVGDIKNMNKETFADLIAKQGEGVLAYGQALARGTDGGIKAAKAIVAGNGDEAGEAAIRMLRKLEEGAAELSVEEVKRVAAQLGPKRSKAFLSAVAAEAQKGASRANLVKALGTLVDGLFVFNDAVNIYYSDDSAEEKAGAATGKGVEYTMSTVAGAKAMALGAGLAPAIVIGLSAMAVGELTKEIIGLHYDRQNAAMKEKWAAIELREMVIERMLRVNQLMKAGKVSEAQSMYSKLYRFAFDHATETYGESLFPKLNALEGKLSAAEDQLSANRVINEARLPYNRAFASYQKGADLKEALLHLSDARTILTEADSSLQRLLAKALSKIKQLEGLIQQKIDNATPLEISRVEVPVAVPPGEWGKLECVAGGGIPAYSDATDSGSTGSYTSVAVYWLAPEELGTYTVPIRIRDNIGQVASTEVKVLVSDAVDTEQTDTDTDTGTDDTDTSGSAFKGDEAALFIGVWAVEGTCTASYLGASLQYLSDSKEKIQEASNAMLGHKTPLPDLDLGQVKRMHPMWTVSRDGDYYVITSSGYTKESGLGGSRYRIKFTGPDTFVGTMDSNGRFGKEMNKTSYRITGRRK